VADVLEEKKTLLNSAARSIIDVLAGSTRPAALEDEEWEAIMELAQAVLAKEGMALPPNKGVGVNELITKYNSSFRRVFATIAGSLRGSSKPAALEPSIWIALYEIARAACGKGSSSASSSQGAAGTAGGLADAGKAMADQLKAQAMEKLADLNPLKGGLGGLFGKKK
jgi:hypothetical protein